MGISVALLHLSDLHLSNVEGGLGIHETIELWREREKIADRRWWRFTQSTFDARVLSGLWSFIEENLDESFSIIISGDLAASGRARDLRAARRVLLEAAPVEAEHAFKRLRLSRFRLGLMPGNHDRYHPIRKSLSFPFGPGSTAFDSVFHDYWSSRVKSLELTPKDSAVRLFAVFGDLSLQSASHAESAKGWYSRWKAALGQGKAYDNVCKEMAAQTTQIRATAGGPVEIVWCVHFPPRVLDDENLRLVDESRLVRAARASRVAHVFCGHVHRARRIRLGQTNPIEFHVAGSALACIEEERNTFFVHRIKKASRKEPLVVESECFGYSRLEGTFVKRDVPSIEIFS